MDFARQAILFCDPLRLEGEEADDQAFAYLTAALYLLGRNVTKDEGLAHKSVERIYTTKAKGAQNDAFVLACQMDASVFGALLDLGLYPGECDEFNYTALDEVRNMSEGPSKKELTSLLIERGLFPASGE